MSHQCSCPCGETRFTVESTPFARFYCHCEICQKLYGKAYSDVTVVRTKHVHLDHDLVEYNNYRLPPALSRGTCKSCNKPVAGFLKGIPGLALAFITADNYDVPDDLPKPLGHIFCHRQQEKIEDNLPQLHGYWPSQMAISKWVIPRLLKSE